MTSRSQLAFIPRMVSAFFVGQPRASLSVHSYVVECSERCIGSLRHVQRCQIARALCCQYVIVTTRSVANIDRGFYFPHCLSSFILVLFPSLLSHQLFFLFFTMDFFLLTPRISLELFLALLLPPLEMRKFFFYFYKYSTIGLNS